MCWLGANLVIIALAHANNLEVRVIDMKWFIEFTHAHICGSTNAKDVLEVISCHSQHSDDSLQYWKTCEGGCGDLIRDILFILYKDR